MNKKALSLVSLAISILLLLTVPALASSDKVTGKNFSSALKGIWSGTDNLGNILVMITANGRITISHPGCDLLPDEGTFVAEASTIYMILDEDAIQIYRYLLAGDTMLLADEELQFPVTLTRSTGETSQSDAEKLIGTWGGDFGGTYGEVTFNRDGTLSAVMPNIEDLGRTGTYTVEGNTIKTSMEHDNEEITFEFIGESLILSEYGMIYAHTGKPGPLERTVAEKEKAGPGLDAGILGTFGGMEANLYVEWTFHGDGTFQRYVPQDDFLCYEGTYETKNGILTMHTTEAVLTGAYTVEEDVLGIAFDKDDSFGYRRKTGPLKRIGNLGE